VAGNPSPNNIIKVQAHDFPPFDVSNAVFAIVNPGVTVISPNGGEELRVGLPFALQWNSSGLTGDVKLEINRNNGGGWLPIFPGATTTVEGLNTAVWTVTGPDTANAQFRVTSVDIPGATDTSDASFRIVTPRITVQAPNGGERWFTQTVQAITWASQGIDANANVKIELSRDGGSSFSTIIGSTPNTGSANWTVQAPASAKAIVRVTGLDPSGVSDVSNSVFEIREPSIKLLAPSGGQEFLIGSHQSINWTPDGVTGDVDIELSRNNGGSWELLATVPANNRTFDWLVAGNATSTALVRVKMHSRPEIFGKSNRTFTISKPTLTVTSPTAGSSVAIGRSLAITWSGPVVRVGGGTVDIQLSRNGGATWDTIIVETLNDGAVSWSLVTAPTTTRAKIRVIWKPNPSVRGDSGQFTIR